MAQLFLFAYAFIKSSARAINWNRLNTPFPHPSYIPFIFPFFSLSPLPFQSPTGIGFMFHFLRIRSFGLSHTWLPVKIILARSLFMVIRYLPFCSCLQSEIDGLYQNIYFQTFIEQNEEWNTKGAVHEIPGIFLLSELCLHLLLLPITREFSRNLIFFLNRWCNEFHFISFFVKEHRTLQMIFPTNLINTPSICKRYWYPIDIYSFQPPFNVNKQNQNQGAKKIPKHKSNRKIVKGVHKVKNY